MKRSVLFLFGLLTMEWAVRRLKTRKRQPSVIRSSGLTALNWNKLFGGNDGKDINRIFFPYGRKLLWRTNPFLKIEQLNKVSTLEVVQFVRGSAHVNKWVCLVANSSVNEAALFGCRSYTFLKMQQLNKVSTLETVAFVREKRTHQYASFRKKTWRLRWAASVPPLNVSLPPWMAG